MGSALADAKARRIFGLAAGCRPVWLRVVSRLLGSAALDKDSVSYLHGAQINRATGANRFDTAIDILKKDLDIEERKERFHR